MKKRKEIELKKLKEKREKKDQRETKSGRRNKGPATSDCASLVSKCQVYIPD